MLKVKKVIIEFDNWQTQEIWVYNEKNIEESGDK